MSKAKKLSPEERAEWREIIAKANRFIFHLQAKDLQLFHKEDCQAYARSIFLNEDELESPLGSSRCLIEKGCPVFLRRVDLEDGENEPRFYFHVVGDWAAHHLEFDYSLKLAQQRFGSAFTGLWNSLLREVIEDDDADRDDEGPRSKDAEDFGSFS